MGTTDKQYIGQFFGYLPLICKKLPKYSLEETLVLKRLSIIYICLCDGEIQYLPAVVDGNMQLEAIEPSHCRLSYFSNPFKHLVAFNPFIIAYSYWCRVYKGYA